MGDPLETLKAELERFGEANDVATNERPRRMLNISRDTGEFLAVLVRATAARRVLEIGTSNGYSTLWLADAARAIGSSVTTVDVAEYKIGLASVNFARSGLSPFITLVHDDAGRLLQRSDQSAYDLIFLDSERPEYPGWWPHLRRVLCPGGLLIVDNATSHAEQMAPFVALVTADPEFATCLIPVGNGEFLAVKTRREAAAEPSLAADAPTKKVDRTGKRQRDRTGARRFIASSGRSQDRRMWSRTGPCRRSE